MANSLGRAFTGAFKLVCERHPQPAPKRAKKNRFLRRGARGLRIRSPIRQAPGASHELGRLGDTLDSRVEKRGRGRRAEIVGKVLQPADVAGAQEASPVAPPRLR